MGERLAVHGLGVATDAFGDVRAFAAAQGGVRMEGLEGARVIGEEEVASQDVIAQWTIRAIHQAWTMAGMTSGERTGLLLVSAWGTVDATVAYLESMLESEGRFASPRHFSRSVYSSVASVAAIHFGMKGPCQTLAFGEGAVKGTLAQARRMVVCGRAERVVVVWADQAAEIAGELAGRAAARLGRREYGRYEAGLGAGAVAAVLGKEERGALGVVDVGRPGVEVVRGQKPFATDEALGWGLGVLRGRGR